MARDLRVVHHGRRGPSGEEPVRRTRLAQQAGLPGSSGLAPERGLDITREYVTAFFDQTLKGIHVPLLDGPSPANLEVLFQY